MSPRSVRNFWIEVEVDGKQEKIATGPMSKDGGMNIQLFQREAGGVTEVLTIFCRCNEHGMLSTEVVPSYRTLQRMRPEESSESTHFYSARD